MTPLFGDRFADDGVREAAWIARCVGDTLTAPLKGRDLDALASYLAPQDYERGAPIFSAGQTPPGIWIMRSGLGELVAGTGRRRLVLRLLRPGEVDGDIQFLLGMQFPYGARAIEATRCLFLESDSFEKLLREHPAIARRWLSSVAERVSRSQMRILQLLGRSLTEQTARLLLDEADDGRVPLPQRTLAAMLGVQRPSLNKVLRDLERGGLIGIGYGRVEIKDPTALERLAGTQ
ncbi:MAG: Crp/Fnr family transcriptional regulator [Actinobacteria bacterium]|nr:Crp/Fnr family transcriptional regulator [Actinomycetota bacterium]